MSTVRDLVTRALVPPERRALRLEQRSIVSRNYGSLNIDYIGGGSAGLGAGRLAFNPSDALSRYQANEVFYRCIKMKSSELAAINLVLDRDGEYDETNTIAQRYNRSSTDADNAIVQKQIMWAKHAARGECFVFMDRGDTGEAEPLDFMVLMDRVTPVFMDTYYDDAGNPRERTRREKVCPTLAGYKVSTRWGDVDLLPSEVLWFRDPHFDIPWAPMAAGEAALIATGLDSKAREWQASEFDNTTKPPFHVYAGDIPEDSAKMFKAQLEAQTQGAANAGRPMVTYGPQKTAVDMMTLSPQEMSYIESHGMNGKDICVALGIPVDLIFGQSTFDNQEAAWTRAWQTWSSDLKLVAAEIDRQLFPEETASAIFDLRGVAALQENTDAIQERATKAWLADGLTFAAYKDKLGEDAWGDERDDMTYTQYIKSLSAPVPDALKDNAEAPPDNVIPIDKNKPTPEEQDALDQAEADQAAADKAAAKRLAEMNQLIRDEQLKARDIPPEAFAKRAKRRVVNVDRVLRAYDLHERLLRRDVERLAEKQWRSVERNLRKAERKADKAVETRDELRPDAIFKREDWTEMTAEAIAGSLERLWLESGLATAAELDMDAGDDFTERVLLAMRARLEILAKRVTQTTYEVIRDEILKEGVEQGEGILDLTNRIKAHFDDLKTWRAETIARTEVVGGHNGASLMAAQNSGVVTGKSWLRTHDDRVRPSHEALGDSDAVIKLDGRFANGLLFPGDPTGLPSESIACRCTLSYELDDA